MATYKLGLPTDYAEIIKLGDIVDETILNRKVPQPDHIARIFGDECLGSYYFMHALMHDQEYGGRKRGIFDYLRRDGKAVQIHSFDGAFKPFYRFHDSVLPSGYYLSIPEIIDEHLHDVPEEFGRTLSGALIVNDVIDYQFGEDVGKNVGLLTNYNALMIDSLERRIKQFPDADTENPNSLYEILDRERNQVSIRPWSVVGQYRRVSKALRNFRTYVEEEVEYMPGSQKDRLLGVMDDLIHSVSGMRKDRSFLEPDDLKKLVTERYEHVMEIMKNGEYVEVDSRLVLPGNSKFLATLKKTLYYDFINNISGAVKESVLYASQNGHGRDASCLRPMMVKLAESTNTASNMERIPLENATSIFRKARILMAAGIGLAKYLKKCEGYENDYERLKNGVKFLFGNLSRTVDDHLEDLKRRVQRETNLVPDLEIFELMRKKTRDLERLVASMEEQGWLERSVFGKLFRSTGIEKLTIGGTRFVL